MVTDRKAIFLDIDGTLIGYDGTLPQSTMEAVARARANGHYVFICTGRALSEVVGEVNKLDVDGKVCGAGAYVQIGEHIIRNKTIPLEKLKLIIDFFTKNNINFCLEGPKCVYVNTGTKDTFKKTMKMVQKTMPGKEEEVEKHMSGFLSYMVEVEDFELEDVNKVTFFTQEHPIADTIKVLGKHFQILPNSMPAFGENSGEIMMQGVHKASGIACALEYLDLPVSKSFGYGDGMNDIEMLEYVGMGVAMGNAHEAVKKVAKDVTAAVDEDGIYKSFEKYGLI